MGMGDLDFSMQLRDTLKRMINEYVNLERPRPRYAQVDSIDRTARKCGVIFNGETGPVTVNMGALQPSAVGQIVRVEGIGTDKYIADVVGNPFIDQVDVNRLRVKSTADVAESGSDAGDPVIIGDEAAFHVAMDNNEMMAFSAPGVRTPYGLNSGATIPLDQIGTGLTRVPNLQWVTGEIQTAIGKMAKRVLVGERFITPVANTPTSGAVTFPAGYFSDIPTVVTTPNTSVPGSTVQGTSATAITTSGFNAVGYRTNTTGFGIMWVAIQMD